MLADIIYVIHVLLIMAICFSVFFPTGEWLKYTIVLIPLVMLDWKDRDKQCSLTSLEAKIRGTWTPGNSNDKDAPEFFRPLLNKILKPFGQEKLYFDKDKIELIEITYWEDSVWKWIFFINRNNIINNIKNSLADIIS